MPEDEDQEFLAAFKEASSGEKPAEAEVKPEGAPQETGDETQAAEPTQTEGAAETPPAEQSETNSSDIWAGATPEQRAAYEAASEQARKLDHQRRSDDGRVSRYQRERDEAKRKLETIVTAAQKSGEDLQTLMGSEEWKKTLADYGDDLKPVFSAIEKLAERTDGFGESLKQSTQADLDEIEVRNTALLTEVAPDWRFLLGRQDFPSWLESQPPHWQAAFQMNAEKLVAPEAALELVNRYRAHVFLQEAPAPTPDTQPDPKRAAQLDAARTVKTRQPVVADAGSEDFDGHFQRAAAERQKARATAR